MTIPKIIHTYWEGKKSPFAEECFRRMKSFHNGWIVKIHNSNTFTTINRQNLTVTTPQFKSDVVRIHHILSEGGVWIDATCYLLKPVDAFIDMNSGNVIGYGAPWQDNVLENWFFAAPTNHPLVQAWHKEYIYAHSIGFDKYKENLPLWVKQEGLYDFLPYLTMHACYRIVSHNLNIYADLLPSINGPFKYLHDNNWKSIDAVTELCNTNKIQTYIDYNIPFLKIRGDERPIIDGLWNVCRLNKKRVTQEGVLYLVIEGITIRTVYILLLIIIALFVYIHIHSKRHK